MNFLFFSVGVLMNVCRDVAEIRAVSAKEMEAEAD